MFVFTISLIRHGETDYNKKRIIQGQMDTELSAKGVNQAELCGLRLQHDKFTYAYCSDLKRVIVTAENILKYNGVTKCPLKQDIRLRERNFGEYEGRSCDDFMDLVNRSNFTHIQDFAPPRGESLREVRARAVEWFNEVCQSIRDLLEGEMAKQSNHGNHIGRDLCGDYTATTPNSEVIDENGGACNDSAHQGSDSNSDISVPQNSCSKDQGEVTRSVPDVLVVSHGGFLKELIAFFCQELGAVLPDGMKSMRKTPHNTAISKFSVSLNADGQARMSCLMLNDRDHLAQADVMVVKVDEI